VFDFQRIDSRNRCGTEAEGFTYVARKQEEMRVEELCEFRSSLAGETTSHMGYSVMDILELGGGSRLAGASGDHGFGGLLKLVGVSTRLRVLILSMTESISIFFRVGTGMNGQDKR